MLLVHLEHVVGGREGHVVASVKIIACSTLMVCAMFVITIRSAWRWKMSKWTLATSASRNVFCWYRNPGLVPASTFHQVPPVIHHQPDPSIGVVDVALVVRDMAVLADVEASVDPSAEVLGKMAVRHGG
jgi:hypothetical protein